MLKIVRAGLALAAMFIAVPAQGQSRLAEIKDAETRAWWSITEALSGDDMEGRDTGTPGYERAASLVAARFAKAGLRPAGDNGTWRQSVPIHEVAIAKAGTTFVLVAPDGAEKPLRFLHEISVRAAADTPASLEGALTFRGYCAPSDLTEVAGKIVVCFNTRRQGLTKGGERVANVLAAGGLAIVHVDDPGFTIEPYRWPRAYERSAELAGTVAKPTIPTLPLSPKAFAAMLAGSGRDADAILAGGGAKRPLPAFDIPMRLRATFNVVKRDYTANNILALLPGTDPALASEHVILTAHLDGYGYGEPVDGDNLYNGALDDAAYVALLVRIAEQRQGKGFKRGVLFAVVTGEEIGLLGSRWYADHPTLPLKNAVAVLNLDQLRPLYPLKILTTLAVDETTLGDTARNIAAPMGVEVRADVEPERGLLQRTDHWPLMEKCVPPISFIFGFDPGTEAEARHREWYRTRYHRPQDDISQPMDFEAARDFNTFYSRLVAEVANAPERPTWKPDSRYRPKP